MARVIKQAICAISVLLCTQHALAGSDICASASTINPNAIDGGMGGTGIIANGGLGGTGMTAEGGVGGTGVTQEGGLGGTGMTAEGGLGGTGVSTEHGGMGGAGDALTQKALLPDDEQGGITIIGVVTGFASICVNGEEVHYSANTPILDNGKTTQLSQMATGKMVVLKADKLGGQLHARAIGLFDAVAGPVSRLDLKQNQMQVMGQTVRLNQNLMQQMHAVDTSKVVARVSGHRLNNGEIVATRVDIEINSIAASTIGLVTSVEHDGVIVNGTRVNIDNKKILDAIKVGSEVRVNGVWNGRAMQANQVEMQPIKNMINRADSAIIEGFARAGSANSIGLEGTEVLAAQGNTNYAKIGESHGKVVKIELSRDKNGNWVCDKLVERKGKLFGTRKPLKGDGDASSGNSSSGGDDSGSNSGSDSSGSGHGSNSDSESSSGSNSGSDHDSSSGSSRGTSRGTSSGSGSERDSTSGSSRDTSRDTSSGSGSGRDSSGSGRSGGSGSGKYK